MITLDWHEENIAVYVDYQGLCKHTQILCMTLKIIDQMTISLPENIADLSKHNTVGLQWILSHIGTSEDDTADTRVNAERFDVYGIKDLPRLASYCW